MAFYFCPNIKLATLVVIRTEMTEKILIQLMLITIVLLFHMEILRINKVQIPVNTQKAAFPSSKKSWEDRQANFKGIFTCCIWDVISIILISISENTGFLKYFIER